MVSESEENKHQPDVSGLHHIRLLRRTKWHQNVAAIHGFLWQNHGWLCIIQVAADVCFQTWLGQSHDRCLGQQPEWRMSSKPKDRGPDRCQVDPESPDPYRPCVTACECVSMPCRSVLRRCKAPKFISVRWHHLDQNEKGLCYKAAIQRFKLAGNV